MCVAENEGLRFDFCRVPFWLCALRQCTTMLLKEALLEMVSQFELNIYSNEGPYSTWKTLTIWDEEFGVPS